MDASRALVVQDDGWTRIAMRCVLVRCGFEVTEVGSTGEALETAAAIRPRVVVVDLAVTGRMGLQVVPAFHVASPGTAVFVVSAFPRLRQPARQAGAADLVDFEDPRVLERQLHRLNPGPHPACRCGVS